MAKVNGFHQCCNHANKCIFPRMLSHVCYYFAYSSMNWPTFCINCLLYILHNSIWVIGHIISKPNFVLISLLIFSSLWTVPYMIDTSNTNVWANHANRFYIYNWPTFCINCLLYILHNSIWVIGHIISKPNFVLISLLIFSSLWTVPYMIDTSNTNVWANHANRFYIANDLKPSIKELPYVLCILSVWHLKNYTRSAVIARQQGPQSSYTFLTV